MKLLDGRWIDDEGNSWCAVRYTEEQALKKSESLVCCLNCSDCQGCSNCSNCSNCFDCSGCFDCFGCSDCYYCSDCSYCSGCLKCSNCTNCTNCLFCSNCSDRSKRKWRVDQRSGCDGNNQKTKMPLTPEETNETK